MTGKPINNRAWLFVLPVLAFVLFSSIIPVMTVVNYSIQDTMGANNFFWNGDAWFRDLLNPSTEIGARFNDALFRTLAFSLVCLLIEVPLGIAIALCIPRSGWLVGLDAGRDGAADAHSVERGGHDLADLHPRRTSACSEPRSPDSACTTT